jgi:hypothetical protein
MANPYREAAERARDKTDEQYASEISSLTRLRDEEIQKLFPARVDKDRLLELLAIVNDSTSENEKINKFKENVEHLAPAVLRLVKVLL